jgi:hypothetical protein
MHRGNKEQLRIRTLVVASAEGRSIMGMGQIDAEDSLADCGVRVVPGQRRKMRRHEGDARHVLSVAGPQIAVVIPALNEEKSIGHVLQAIPQGLAGTVIVVDNGISDRTAGLAHANGAYVLRELHKGYGAKVKVVFGHPIHTR